MYTVWTYLLENHGSLQSDLTGYENQMLAQRLNCKSKFIKKQYTTALVTNNIFIHSRQIFFLFIGREPITWHANNGLLMRNVVQLWLAEKNILHKTTLFSFLRSLFSVKMADCFASFRTFIKNQTWWSNDKTIIELWLSQNIVICQYPPDHDIFLNLVQ